MRHCLERRNFRRIRRSFPARSLHRVQSTASILPRCFVPSARLQIPLSHIQTTQLQISWDLALVSICPRMLWPRVLKSRHHSSGIGSAAPVRYVHSPWPREENAYQCGLHRRSSGEERARGLVKTTSRCRTDCATLVSWTLRSAYRSKSAPDTVSLIA